MSEQRDQYDQCNLCGHVRVKHAEKCQIEGCSCPVFDEMTGETFICPRGQPSPPFHEATARWSVSRWGPHYGAKWPDSFFRPRTCSYCGGVHPHDAIALIVDGWEVEPTTKGYKRYLHPPGTEANTRAFIERIGRGELDEPKPHAAPLHIDPIPPVKLYVQHFSADEIEALNRAMTERKAS